MTRKRYRAGQIISIGKWHDAAALAPGFLRVGRRVGKVQEMSIDQRPAVGA